MTMTNGTLPGGTIRDGSIRIRDLRVSFGGREALRGVDLDVPPGLVTVVIGRSGSGKTTLLRSVNRLNECFPGCRSRGEVLLGLDGRTLDAHAPDLAAEDLRRMAGMVFQSPNVLPMSVERNLLMPMRLVLGLDGDARGRMRRALEEAGLWDEVGDRLGASAMTLSGGQQQRLCLARALALEPRFLLLDEPTASLDYRASLQLEAMIRSQRERRTLLVVSHGLGQARRLADRIVVMRDGRVARVMERGELDACESLDETLEEIF